MLNLFIGKGLPSLLRTRYWSYFYIIGRAAGYHPRHEWSFFSFLCYLCYNRTPDGGIATNMQMISTMRVLVGLANTSLL